MEIGEICNRDVVTARMDDLITEAASLMRSEHVGTLVIIDTDEPPKPMGVLTDRDIAIGIVGKDPEHITQLLVGDVVYRDVITCHEGDDATWVAWRMREHGVRRLPVVDDDGSLVGIVALSDILSMLVEDLSELVEVIREQPIRERQARLA